VILLGKYSALSLTSKEGEKFEKTFNEQHDASGE